MHETQQVANSVTRSAESLRLSDLVEIYLTLDDWRAACVAGQAPINLAPKFGCILARRPGPGPSHTRWHHVAPHEAVDGVWPAPLSPLAGEDCETAAAWLRARHMRASARVDLALNQAAGRYVQSRMTAAKVRYIMHENEPAPPSAPLDWSPRWLVLLGLVIAALLALIAVCAR